MMRFISPRARKSPRGARKSREVISANDFLADETKIEDFIKSRVKNRRDMSKASRIIDEFRQKYGKAGKNFDSLNVIRKMRDSRK